MPRQRLKAPRRKTEADTAAKPDGSPWSRRDLWICLFLLAAILAVYSPVRNHQFLLSDDPDYVTENPRVVAGLTTEGVAWAFTTGHAGNWFPLTWISLMADCELFGVNAGADAAVNALLHALATLLLFVILKRATGASWRAAFVAFLFGLHPIHVESVAWIAERKDVLNALFWFLTVWAYLGYVKRPGFRRYALVLAAFSLALLSKSMAVTLPFALLLLDVWPLRRIAFGRRPDGAGVPPLAAVLREKIPLCALSLAVSVVTFVVQQRSQYVMSLGMVPLSARFANALVSLVAYVAKMLWPAPLAFYPYVVSIPAWQTLFAGLAISTVTVLALRSLRSRPYLAVGWFWYLVTLAPVIGLVQVGSQARADRYTYIPSVGIFLILAWGAADLLGRMPRAKPALVGICVAACAACLPLTWLQVHYWKDTVTLYRHSLGVTKGNYLGYNTLGLALKNQGRLDEALSSYTEAIRINPEFAPAHANLSEVLLKQGHASEAIVQLEETVRLSPEDEEAQFDLGTTLAGEGRFEEAIGPLAAALRLKPDYSKAHVNLGSALANLGRIDEAIEHFTEAVRLTPDSEEARQLLDYALEVKEQSARKK